ncbi:hypothetical protein QWY31_00360 [Cytophagales bacterium LB-30]|uniref:Uncharacterized protein n=1 Tax=Shiella aurantiaca TaxID=3058365 RepID=A0ABT8F0F5_9BACT|nr:hypothetical protein [Shiella aurantiaca]MDN4163927.1 hypothetical protein [Shiella aurantiaca]
MKIASLNELKKTLKNLEPEEVTALCLRLAKFKKENKELLTYCLYEADNEAAFVESVKQEMSEAFQEINIRQLYLAKKTIRKVLRIAQKHSKYSGIAETQIALLLHFCEEMKATKVKIRQHKVLQNLYERQLATIQKLLLGLHEDLQSDYAPQFQELSRY